MSLNVYLEGKTTTEKCECPHCWNEHERAVTEQFFDANITHNLNAMAEEAGIYGVVWRPEENGIEKASQLIEPLECAISAMKADPTRFEKHNSLNGWGLYKNFVPWLEKYLAACRQCPDAAVRVSR